MSWVIGTLVVAGIALAVVSWFRYKSGNDGYATYVAWAIIFEAAAILILAIKP